MLLEELIFSFLFLPLFCGMLYVISSMCCTEWIYQMDKIWIIKMICRFFSHPCGEFQIRHHVKLTKNARSKAILVFHWLVSLESQDIQRYSWRILLFGRLPSGNLRIQWRLLWLLESYSVDLILSGFSYVISCN